MNEAVDKRRTERNGMYDIKQLWQRSHEIIGLALLGHKNKDIALLLGISPVTVSNTLNGPLGEEKLGKMRENRDEEYVKISDRIDTLSQKALDVYNRILDDDENVLTDIKFQKDTADTVALELGGHRSPTKIDSRSLHMTATVAEIEEFKKRGLAAAKESGMVIGVTEESKKTTE